MIIPISVNVLEFTQRKSKKNDQIYNNLICYQYGQEYPELVKIDVPDSKVDEAKDLVGESDQSMIVDFVHNKFGARYKFVKAA